MCLVSCHSRSLLVKKTPSLPLFCLREDLFVGPSLYPHPHPSLLLQNMDETPKQVNSCLATEAQPGGLAWVDEVSQERCELRSARKRLGCRKAKIHSDNTVAY